MERDNTLIERLLPEYFHRTGIDVAYAHGPALSGALPGIRGCWGMNVHRTDGGINSRMGSGIPLSAQYGGPTYGRSGWTAWATFDGTGYLNATSDQTDITCDESFIETENLGLTMGGWICPQQVVKATNQTLMGKWDYASPYTEKAYLMYIEAFTGTPGLLVSSDGNSQVEFAHSTVLTESDWAFVAVLFQPSTRMSIGINGNWETYTTGIPASLHSSANAFTVGHTAGGEYGYIGRMTHLFLSAMYIESAYLDVVYQLSAPLFEKVARL